MIALTILPLLLAFTLIDFGDSGEDEPDEVDAMSTPDDTTLAGDLDVASLLKVIELTKGDDEYAGNNQLNEVDGLGGDDRLLGLGRTDYLEGGAGRLIGANGNLI